jgi:hypothetical protein
MPTPQPFASGTTVTHSPPGAPPWDGIVKGNTIECYLPIGGGAYVKRIGVWDPDDARWEFGNPSWELYHVSGPPAVFAAKQGDVPMPNGAGPCTAVA